MSLASTSSSQPETRSNWRRLRRLGLYVLALLAGLELFCRLPLVEPLRKYEDLLWYDVYLATFNRELKNGSHHALWLLGSSYMMTGLNPAIIQEGLRASGFPDLTVQNYGLNRLQNLEVMGEVFDRWLFELDQPEYAVLAVAGSNFNATPRKGLPILSSPLESALIFPDSLDDYVGGFLYQHSALYHHAVLLRHVIDTRDAENRWYFIDRVLPLGGYEDNDRVYQPSDCDLSAIRDEAEAEWLRESAAFAGYAERMAVSYAQMDAFIAAIQRRGIPLAMVIIPDQACTIAQAYRSYANYNTLFIQPLLDHIRALGVPVVDLNAPFQAAVEPGLHLLCQRQPSQSCWGGTAQPMDGELCGGLAARPRGAGPGFLWTNRPRRPTIAALIRSHVYQAIPQDNHP